VARSVVARTIESSTTTSRLPATLSSIALKLIRTALSRSARVGAMNVRPMYRFLISPSPYDAGLGGVPLCAGYRRVRDRHDHVGVDGRLPCEGPDHPPARRVDADPGQLAVGPGDVDELERAQRNVREAPI
jgi:hypothetical protein